MGRIAKWLACVALSLCIPFAAAAQDDKTLIVRYLQDALSGMGRDVQIEGFSGALSSRATMDRLTIADEQGIWLTLTDAVLDWNRTAILRGRVEINELSAARIELPRLGQSNQSISPEAREFSLPTLPVSIRIDDITVEELVLGEPVLGIPVTAAANGALVLEDGEGSADLQIDRLDEGPSGSLSLQAGFDNSSRILEIDLRLDEGQDGIAATLLNLPDTPPINMSVTGSGPIDEFTATISLESGGHQRLAGQITTQKPVEEPGASRTIAVDMSGDLTQLFAPEYRPFFGPQVALNSQITIFFDGRVALDDMNLTAAALKLNGQAVLSADRMPERFSLQVDLSDPTGAKVLLPSAGPEIWLGRADITASFDQDLGDRWALTAQVVDMTRDQTQLDLLKLTASGAIRNDPVQSVTAAIETTIDGLKLPDDALAQVLGNTLSATASGSWRENEPVLVSGLNLTTQALTLTGQGTVEGLNSNGRITGSARAQIKELAQFSDLLGRQINGALNAQLSGEATLLDGAFDASIKAVGTDLSVGLPQVDRALVGTSRLNIDARRDTTGLTLRSASITTAAGNIDATGTIATLGSNLGLSVELNDIGQFVPELTGPARLTGSATQTGERWEIDTQAQGPAGIKLSAQGQVEDDAGSANLAFQGNAPLGLLNPRLAPNSVQGMALFDLRLNGPIALSSVQGRVQTNNTRVSIPALQNALTGIDAVIDLDGSAAQLGLQATAANGGTISASGQIGLAQHNAADIRIQLSNVVLRDPKLFETATTGELRITGALPNGLALSGQLAMDQTDIRVPTSTTGTAGAIPPIAHVNEPASVRQTRNLAGLISSQSTESAGRDTNIGLNVQVLALNKIFIRGRGLDAELGGQVRVTGTSADPVPIGQFNLIRGRLDILGKRLALVEGSARLDNGIIPNLRLVARTSVEDTVIDVIVEGPADDPTIGFASTPDLPEDEVLAQLLFGRDIRSISAFQAVQLASAVATLAGRGGDGVIEKLRQSTGIDDLDVTSAAAGETTLRAGKYISENAYTNVEIDNTGQSSITLNLDLSPSTTVRGQAGTDGSTSLGLFFERDY